jgi:hypothetical protein
MSAMFNFRDPNGEPVFTTISDPYNMYFSSMDSAGTGLSRLDRTQEDLNKYKQANIVDDYFKNIKL